MEDNKQACHADRAAVEERPNAALVALANALAIRRTQRAELEREHADGARLADVDRQIGELCAALRALGGTA